MGQNNRSLHETANQKTIFYSSSPVSLPATTLHTVGEPAVRAAAKTVLSCFICQSFCSVTGSDLFRLYLNEVVIPILFCTGGREFKPIGAKYSSVDPIFFLRTSGSGSISLGILLFLALLTNILKDKNNFTRFLWPFFCLRSTRLNIDR